MRKFQRALQCESLEDRRMKAGDVTASLQNGDLYITEAAGKTGQNNAILISEVSRGTVRIQGESASGSGAASLVNGAAYQDFHTAGNLFVNFGAGDDKVEFSALGPAITLRSVDLNLGPVSVLRGVTDKDSVSVSNLQTTGGLSIYTGADADTVYVGNSHIGDYAGNDQLWIKTGAGADLVACEDSAVVAGSLFVQTYDALSENDADTFYSDRDFVVAGNASISLGGGADQVFFGNSAAGSQGYEHSVEFVDSLTLDTGTGNDQVWIYNASTAWSASDTTTILTGAGSDLVDIDGQSTAIGHLNLQMCSLQSETDVDTMHLHNGQLALGASITFGSGNDRLTVDSSDPSQTQVVVTGSLYIDMGAGDDYVSMTGIVVGFTVADTLSIHTGAGSDTVNLTHCEYLQTVAIQTYDSLLENDSDSVTTNDVFAHGNMTVMLGGGSDFFFIENSVSFLNMSIDSGAGNDRGYGYGASAFNQLSFNMSDGDDTLVVDHLFAHKLILAGGNGSNDRLARTANIVDTIFSEVGWEHFSLYDSWADELQAYPFSPNTHKIG